VSFNQIVNVSPLSGLTNLTFLNLEVNQIVDMCPLVNNLGLDSGDVVDLQANSLATNSCTVCIPQLEGRGVYVGHSCAVDDADGDCLPDHLDPCPLDQDCDDDGLIDGNCFSGDLSGQDSRVKASGECVGYCGTEDVNNNGLVDFGETDPELFDTDGDGISDGVEKGLVEPVNPEATDPLVFVPDADPSTTTDPTNPDTDRDGIPDGVEDLNHNGQVDEGETDPNVGDNGPCSGSASASTHQASTVYGSKVLTRHLAYLLLPVGVAILLTSRRRRK
jgi:hypothetical protein